MGTPLPDRLVAFDLETTGIHEETDRIVEFSFVELDPNLEELGRWTERVDPGVPIPEQATAVHGITDADVAGKPPFARHAPRIQRLLSGAVLIAYNHVFDVTFIDHELRRAAQPGLDVNHPVIDPFELFREQYSHKLEQAVRTYLDREHDGAHGAEADTVATIEVLRAQRATLERLRDAPLSEALVKKDKHYLDWSRKVYLEDDGVAYFNFGKHAGRPVMAHVDYVNWVLKSNFPDSTKAALRKVVAAAQPDLA